MSEIRTSNTHPPKERQAFPVSSNGCTRCGLPITWEITRLDNRGVCNYCRFYDTVRGRLRGFDRWKQLFSSHIARYKGQFEYDAVVGFSGGKDSSYILYTLKEHYQCRVLAVTVDFGFMPTGPAKENAKRVAEHLGIDHLVYEMRSEQVRRCFRARIRKGMLPCEFCTVFCSIIPRKIAIERDIPFYIMGSDRGQLLRSLSPETAPASGASYINWMLTPYSAEKTLRGDNPKDARRMRAWLRRCGLPAEFAAEIYPSAKCLPKTDAVSLGLQFFLFHPYREKEIKRILINEAGWHLPSGDHLHAHHDCVLHDAATHFMREALGTSLTAGEICVDVREGEIGRDEAVEVLAKEERYLNSLQQPYAAYEEYLGISEEDVRRASRRFRRRVTLLRSLRELQMLFRRPRLRLLDNE